MSNGLTIAEVAASVGWTNAIAALVGYLSVIGHALWWLLWQGRSPRTAAPPSWVAAKFVCASCGEPWAEVYHIDAPGEHRCSVCGTVTSGGASDGR